MLANPMLANPILDLVCVCHCGAKGWDPNPEKVGLRKSGPRTGVARREGGPIPEKIGPRRVGPRRVGGPRFRAFVSHSRSIFALFVSLSVCLLVEFWWCLKRQDPRMCTFGVLGLLCESPAASGGKGPIQQHTTTHNITQQHTTTHNNTHTHYNTTQHNTKMDRPKMEKWIGPNWPNHMPLTSKFVPNWIGQNWPAKWAELPVGSAHRQA